MDVSARAATLLSACACRKIPFALRAAEGEMSWWAGRGTAAQRREECGSQEQSPRRIQS